VNKRPADAKRTSGAPDEIVAGRSLHPSMPLKRDALKVQDVPACIARGSYGRPASAPARFKPGDRVGTKNMHPRTHTRLPRYARGRCGVVDRAHGCQVFPDSSALGAGDDPQWLYTVVFDGRELWGADADPALKVSIDAFEPYLESA
jgi:nitrile hydratase subunit beta